eukprot:113124-Rhodomonas_salina.2
MPVPAPPAPAPFPLDLRVGQITSATALSKPGSVLFQVDVGRAEPVSIVASLPSMQEDGGADGEWTARLVGRKVCALLNLDPIAVDGRQSEGMLLVADQLKPRPLQILVECDAPVGSVVAPKGGVVLLDGQASRKVVQKQRLRVGDSGAVRRGEHELVAGGSVAVRAERAAVGSVVR